MVVDVTGGIKIKKKEYNLLESFGAFIFLFGGRKECAYIDSISSSW